MRPLVSIVMLGLAMAVLPLHAQDIPAHDRLSGFEMMGADVQAMQRDDFSNPAMLSVREGEQLWSRAPAQGKKSCQGCHHDVATSMTGVAARYPAFDAGSNRPIDLAGRIQQCQTERQGVQAAPRESALLLALQALVALQSRGMPIAATADPRLAAARERGQALFNQRFGQLNLSCAQCHNQNWGKSLGGTRIPQGQDRKSVV